MLKRAYELIVKRRDFGLLIATQLASQAGDGVVQAALAKFIVFGGQEGFDLEGARSPDELLRIALYLFIPYTIVSPFLGVVIDRWDRRRLLFLANGLRAAAVAVLGLAGIGVFGDFGLFLAFLFTLAGGRVVLATKSAALPETVERDDLVEANAVSQLGGAIAQLGGAGVAVVGAEFISTRPIVLIGAVVYAIGAFAALAIRKAGEVRPRTTFGQEVARVARNILEGFREVARTPKAAASISTYFWLRLLWSFSIVGVGFEARELLAGDDLQIVLLTGGAGAAGGALGFLLARRMHTRVRTTAHLVLSASVVAGGAVAALGLLEIKLSIAVLVFFLGLGFFLAKISLDTMVQEALGDGFRGRAFALYDIAYNLAWVVAAAIMKIAWTPSSQGVLIAGMGVAFLVGTAGIAAWFRRAGLLSTPVAAQR